MARVLIVGCGCRGQALAARLVEDGHAVRGTSRSEERLAGVRAAGAEAVLGDPDRLGTLLPALQGVSLVCWLMGSASSADVHGPRLQSLVEKLVDTPVRGFLYEAAGPADPAILAQGAAIARAARETYRIPVELIDADPADHEAWLAASSLAVSRLLMAPPP